MSEIIVMPAFIVAVNIVALVSLIAYSVYRKVTHHK